jgi:hexokinase
MGKGFLAVVDLLGHDPGALMQQACLKRGLKALVRAIVNDTCEALLSEAHLDSSGRFGLVLGTGINVAVYLPVRAISLSKFGTRPSSWYDSAHNVIVNTELSTFGGRILPLTKWDELLLSAHPNPDLQPLEYLVGGG